MPISSIADKKACGGAIGANTGRLGCLSLFGEPDHFIAMRKGSVILATDTFDLAFITPLVQKGDYIPIIDASSFEDVSAEDTYSTSSGGVKRLNLKGLPEYKLMFEEGHEFYRQLAKLEGYKSFDFMIGDEEGNWMLATKSNGDFQGFKAGHHTPELTKRKASGGDAESKALLVQFLDRLQWDQNYSILHSDQLTFTPQEIPAVNGAVLAYAIAPSDTDTTVDVSVILASDNDTPVEGLLEANFIIKVDGVTATISGLVETTPGVYTITIPAVAAGENVVTDLWDNTLNVDVTNLAGVLYRGEEIAALVV